MAPLLRTWSPFQPRNPQSRWTPAFQHPSWSPPTSAKRVPLRTWMSSWMTSCSSCKEADGAARWPDASSCTPSTSSSKAPAPTIPCVRNPCPSVSSRKVTGPGPPARSSWAGSSTRSTKPWNCLPTEWSASRPSSTPSAVNDACRSRNGKRSSASCASSQWASQGVPACSAPSNWASSTPTNTASASPATSETISTSLNPSCSIWGPDRRGWGKSSLIYPGSWGPQTRRSSGWAAYSLQKVYHPSCGARRTPRTSRPRWSPRITPWGPSPTATSSNPPSQCTTTSSATPMTSESSRCPRARTTPLPSRGCIRARSPRTRPLPTSAACKAPTSAITATAPKCPTSRGRLTPWRTTARVCST